MIKLALLTIVVILQGAVSFAEEPEACNIETKCIEDQSLRVQIESVRIRGNIANISIMTTNLTNEDILIGFFGEYLAATSASGERIHFNTNRDETAVVAKGKRAIAFSLKFSKPVGKEFDLVLTFESPNSSYAFFDLSSYK